MITLKPTSSMNRAEWRSYYLMFRDKKLAALNDSKAIWMPFWMFRLLTKLSQEDADQAGFAVMNDKNQLIGNVELYDFRPASPQQPITATLGIMLKTEYWGKGYGQESLRLIVQWGFQEQGLQTITLMTLADNERAQRAFKKQGFKETRRSQEGNSQFIHMELSREDFLAHAASFDDIGDFGRKIPSQNIE